MNTQWIEQVKEDLRAYDGLDKYWIYLIKNGLTQLVGTAYGLKTAFHTCKTLEEAYPEMIDHIKMYPYSL